MFSSNIELVQKYIDDDELCRKDIGADIKAFRTDNMFVNRDVLSRKINYSFCTITNVEMGKYYPKIDLLMRLNKYGGSPVYFVLKQNCRIETRFEDLKLLDGCDEKQKISILIKIMCDKYEMYNLYNENIIKDLCVLKPDINRDNVGYLIKLERTKKNISQQQLADWLRVEVKKIKDIEKGNSSIPFKKIYFISHLLNVPIDYFIMECLETKECAINYLLSEIFGGVDKKEREYYVKYIELLKFKIELDKQKNKSKKIL